MRTRAQRPHEQVAILIAFSSSELLDAIQFLSALPEIKASEPEPPASPAATFAELEAWWEEHGRIEREIDEYDMGDLARMRQLARGEPINPRSRYEGEPKPITHAWTFCAHARFRQEQACSLAARHRLDRNHLDDALLGRQVAPPPPTPSARIDPPASPASVSLPSPFPRSRRLGAGLTDGHSQVGRDDRDGLGALSCHRRIRPARLSSTRPSCIRPVPRPIAQLAAFVTLDQYFLDRPRRLVAIPLCIDLFTRSRKQRRIVFDEPGPNVTAGVHDLDNERSHPLRLSRPRCSRVAGQIDRCFAGAVTGFVPRRAGPTRRGRVGVVGRRVGSFRGRGDPTIRDGRHYADGTRSRSRGVDLPGILSSIHSDSRDACRASRTSRAGSDTSRRCPRPTPGSASTSTVGRAESVRTYGVIRRRDRDTAFELSQVAFGNFCDNRHLPPKTRRLDRGRVVAA